MRSKSHPHTIEVTILDSISLNAREAGFLRVMAQHCIDTGMPGLAACRVLVRVLDRMQVPGYPGNPVGDLFEEEP